MTLLVKSYALLLTGGSISKPYLTKPKHHMCSHTDRLVSLEYKVFSLIYA